MFRLRLAEFRSQSSYARSRGALPQSSKQNPPMRTKWSSYDRAHCGGEETRHAEGCDMAPCATTENSGDVTRHLPEATEQPQDAQRRQPHSQMHSEGANKIPKDPPRPPFHEDLHATLSLNCERSWFSARCPARSSAGCASQLSTWIACKKNGSCVAIRSQVETARN